MNNFLLSCAEKMQGFIRQFFQKFGKKLVIGIPYFWLILFFFIPFLIVFKISFSDMVRAIPPYTELLNWEEGKLTISLSANNYLYILEDALDIGAYLFSLKISTLIVFLILFIEQLIRIKNHQKMLSFLSLFVRFLFYSFIGLICIRLISWLNLSFKEFFGILFSLIFSFLFIFLGGKWLEKNKEIYFDSRGKLIVTLFCAIFIFFCLKSFGFFVALENSSEINTVLDKIVMSLSLTNRPIFATTLDLSDSIYIFSYIQSLKIATISTFISVLIAYPLAWAISQCNSSTRGLLLLLIVMPSWTSFLIRIYAWMTILRNNGLLNTLLLKLGIISEPLAIMNTNLAVYIGIVYMYLPFVILPIYNSLVKIDYSLVEASLDLGCKPIKTFFQIVLPLTKGGIIAGSMLIFIPVVGEYVIPELLGGSDTNMIGKVLWDDFFKNRDWPAASAVASVMLLILIIPIYYFNKQQNELGEK